MNALFTDEYMLYSASVRLLVTVTDVNCFDLCRHTKKITLTATGEKWRIYQEFMENNETVTKLLFLTILGKISVLCNMEGPNYTNDTVLWLRNKYTHWNGLPGHTRGTMRTALKMTTIIKVITRTLYFT